MATNIKVRKTNFVDAGLTDQYFIDRGFTVLGTTVDGQMMQITLGEDLTDNEKNELERDLLNDIGGTVTTDVPTGGETETQAEQRYNRVIDRCARKRIRRGFEHPPASGDFYGLDVDSQARWIRYRLHRNNLVYPFRILEQDNRGGVNINDVAEMNAFFGDFHDAMFAIEDDTVETKRDVNTAVGQAASRTVAETYLNANCPALVDNLGP